MNAFKRTRTIGIGAGCMLLSLLLVAGSAAAMEYHLTAEPTSLVMPDGISVPAWGYAVTLVIDADGKTILDEPAALAKVPGDPLEVPWDDPVLKVYLTNGLPEATSVHILGQTMTSPGLPTFAGGRVMSFVKETPNDNTTEILYQWDSLKPGTYLLQSATNPAKQVQMGLFAAVVKDTSATEAYPGVAVCGQRILVFHDVDPEIQLAIAEDRYGESPGNATEPHIPSSPYRKARYFLINGHSFPDTRLDPVGLGQRSLLRFVNAGLETHVPQILNAYMTQVAQDGIALQYTKEMYGFELNPAATIDAVVEMPDGPDALEFTIYDAIVANMSNMGTHQADPPGAPAGGGAVVKLAAEIDSDGDCVVDSLDNCTLVANTDQRDTNGDGFGNRCDPDLNNDGTVLIADFSMFGALYGTTDGDANFNPDADFNGDGEVGPVDYSIFGSYYGQPPGPSGVAP